MALANSKLKEVLLQSFFQRNPMESALLLDGFSESESLKYLTSLPINNAVAIFSRLNPEASTDLIKVMDDDLFVDLFTRLDTHLSSRLMSRFSAEYSGQKISLLPAIISAEISEFLVYRPQTAGFLMDTSVTTFYIENTVQDVLNRIRTLANRQINSIFIVDELGSLVGKIPLQIIAISQPDVELESLLQLAPSINALSPRENILTIMEREDLSQIPVTDVNNKLLGIIRNDVLINATKQELTEDMQAMFGASREEQALSSVATAVKSRLPWLQVNLITAFLASFIVGLFEDTIAQITILAVFLPVVAGQSGNTGNQALAVTMRGLALREVRISQWLVVSRKEIMVGLVNGIAVAVTTGIVVYFWASSAGIALVIGVSMVISMMIAGFAGAAIPMALKAVGQDPATSSSIILTTVTDICGFLSFLGLASALAEVLGIL